MRELLPAHTAERQMECECSSVHATRAARKKMFTSSSCHIYSHSSRATPRRARSAVAISCGQMFANCGMLYRMDRRRYYRNKWLWDRLRRVLIKYAGIDYYQPVSIWAFAALDLSNIQNPNTNN